MSELAKAIGVSDATMSNFRAGRSHLSFKAAMALEKVLVKYGYSSDDTFEDIMPDDYVSVGTRKPEKTGEYLVKGLLKNKSKVVIAKFNGRDFYSMQGVKILFWRAVPQ